MKKILIGSAFLLFLLVVSVSFLACDFNDINSNVNNGTNSENGESSTYTVTTKSSTDDYGLAGVYTQYDENTFELDAKVELSASVNNGYNFEGWYINNTCLSKEPNYTYIMKKQTVEIEARYSSYTINTICDTNCEGIAGTYTLMNDKKVSVGETVLLSATVNDGYTFDGWYINGVCISENLNCSYVMRKENVNIEPVFSFYTLSTHGRVENSWGNEDAYFSAGTYTTYSNKKISVGKSITLKATQNEGYNFKGWFINGVCVETNTEYTFVMNRNNIDIVACYDYYVLNTVGIYTRDGVNYEFNPPSIATDDIYSNQKI